MRGIIGSFLLATLAFGHGESGRTAQPQGGTGTQVFPTGGPTTPPASGSVGVNARTGWESWWAYHRDRVLAARMRGTPVSGTPKEERLSRKELREGRMLDVMLEALEDKNHSVRSAAAIALGKFGQEAAATPLRRHTDAPREGWFDVREASIYGLALLRLEESRLFFKSVADDKERSSRQRSLALAGLALDGTENSLASVEWHLKYHRSSVRTPPERAPDVPEEERRRFAAHLLGFAPKDAAGVDDLLHKVALGSRRWGPGVQGLAITSLGRRRARDSLPLLFRLLHRRESHKEVKRSAAIAIGAILRPDDEDGIARLAAVVERERGDEVVRHFAVMGLADAGGKHARAHLMDIRRNKRFASDQGRGFVALALGLVANGDGEIKDALLSDYRKARTASARASLALALGLARDARAMPLTIEYLSKTSLSGGGDDPSSVSTADFLAYGTLALGLFGDKDGVPEVRRVLDKYHHPKVRQNAAMALALLLRNDAVPELVELLEESGNVYTKAAAVTALGLLPQPTHEIVDALLAAYRKDGHQDTVRALAITALGMLSDDRAVPVSAAMSRGYNYFIRCLALDEIARFL